MNSKRALLVLGTIFGGLFFLFLIALNVIVGGSGTSVTDGKHAKVGVVEIKDTIEDSKDFTEKLRTFVDRDDIKAIVIRIDSPGGSVGPSQEMRSEIIRARKKKHIVASLGSIAASGGFYAAIGAEKIVSNPGTLTGSIGVVMQHPVLVELMRSAKVDMQTYTSGALKDSGSPFRHPSEQDKAYLQGITQEIYGQFVDAVVESRGLEKAKVLEVADGRVISGQKAKELGLVDELGTLWDAAVLSLALANNTLEPELVYPPKKGGVFAELLEQTAEGTAKYLRGSTLVPGLLSVGGVLPTAVGDVGAVR